MRQGFFNPSELATSQHVPTVPRCGLCKLGHSCITTNMRPSGIGKKEVLVVEEYPGERDDRKGTQLVGESGRAFRNLLLSVDIKLNRDCWKTNAVTCRHPDGKEPTKEQITACRPNLMNTIKELDPHTIILLGKTSIQSLLPVVWKDSAGEDITKWAGWNIPSQKLNTWICPTFSPTDLLKRRDDLLDTLMITQLKKAFRHKRKPWETLPDYKNQIEIITRPSRAARIIRKMIKNGRPVSFDYETNCLKPEEETSEIICCSVCQNGQRTIAYPWVGEAITASEELFRSKVRKVGANIKFEERWTLNKLGIRVRNWYWDTMLASHILDNRKGITSVKFQSFVRLGVEGYDSHIRPFLKTAKKTRINHIKDLPISDVLLYCGIDSLVEWGIFVDQKKEMDRITVKRD